MAGSRRRPIELGKTPLRYSVDSARAATTALQAYMPAALLTRKFKLEDAVPIIREADLDAIVLFLWQGYAYLDDALRWTEISKLLDAYVRVPGQSRKDFIRPILSQLEADGLIENEHPPEDAEAGHDQSDPTLYPGKRD